MKNREIQREVLEEMRKTAFGDFGDSIGDYNIDSLKREGWGVQIDSLDNEIYIGRFRNNRKDGKGRIINNQFYFEGGFTMN